MEFANLGKHCDHTLCNQQDFLPFVCDSCHKTFCLEHRSYRAHDCKDAGSRDHRVILCPICNKSIHFLEGDNIYVKFENHLRTVCTANPNNNGSSSSSTTGPKSSSNRCPAPHCKEKLSLSNKVMCSSCKQEICLKHRHPDEHNCKSLIPRSAYHSTKKSTTPNNTSLFGNIMNNFMGTNSTKTGGNVLGGGSTATTTKKTGTSTTTTTTATPRSTSGTVTASSSSSSSTNKGKGINPQDLLKESAHRRMAGTNNTNTNGTITTGSSTSVGSHSPSSSSSSSSTSPDACPYCPYTNPDPVALINHVETNHNSNNNSNSTGAEQCPQCGQRFQDVNALIQHSENGACKGNDSNGGNSSSKNGDCVII